MNSYSRIIKAEEVKLTEPPEETPGGFVRGLGTPPPDEREDRGKRPESEPVVEERLTAEEAVSTEREIARRRTAEREAAAKQAHDALMESVERDRRNLSMASESAAKLIRELETLKEKILESSEREILDLVFLIVEKVIHKEVSVDRDVVISVLREAMRTMRGKEDVRIRMNPEDYRYITETNPDFLGSYGDIIIERDEEIARGGTVIETQSGAVDARLDRQVGKIRDALYDEHGF
ncbi:MAG: flagellar assembly protein FliH [Deltaproteobacteria bacterium]|nr:flagellar assembly protein FliH [Deltaproteobacteria bacterium]